jgi:hypothetical protein
MSAKIIPIRPRYDAVRPSGYTLEFLQALEAADALLVQAEDVLKVAYQSVEEDSEAGFEISDALQHLEDARYYVGWREPKGKAP